MMCLSIGFWRKGSWVMSTWTTCLLMSCLMAPVSSAEQGAAFTTYRPTYLIVSARGTGGGSYDLCLALARAMEAIHPCQVNVESMPGGSRAINYLLRQGRNGRVILQHTDSILKFFKEPKQDKASTELDLQHELMPLAIGSLRHYQLYARVDDKRFAGVNGPSWDQLVAWTKANPQTELKVAISDGSKTLDVRYINWLSSYTGHTFTGLKYVAPERFYQAANGTADLLIEQQEDISAFLNNKVFTPIMDLTPLINQPEAARTLPNATERAKGALPNLTGFRAFFIPRQTNQASKDKIHQLVAKALQSPVFTAYLKRSSAGGISFKPITDLDEAAAFFKKQRESRNQSVSEKAAPKP